MRNFAHVNVHVFCNVSVAFLTPIISTSFLIGSAKVAYFNFKSKGRSWSEVRGLIF